MEAGLMRASGSGKPRRRWSPRVLVLGLGNLILRDDGVGVHAARQFASVAPRGVLVIDAGTDVFSTVHLLTRADKTVAFDALRGGRKPGTVYILDASDVANDAATGSLHELGLPSVLQTINGHKPEVVVVAAEPEIIEVGTELSPALQAAVPEMVRAALALTSHWLSLSPAGIRPATDLSAVPQLVKLRQVETPCM
jgi:hydrogenase maturation protease